MKIAYRIAGVMFVLSPAAFVLAGFAIHPSAGFLMLGVVLMVCGAVLCKVALKVEKERDQK